MFYTTKIFILKQAKDLLRYIQKVLNRYSNTLILFICHSLSKDLVKQVSLTSCFLLLIYN